MLGECDPSGEGHISLKSFQTMLKHRLPEPRPPRGMRHAASQPALGNSKQHNLPKPADYDTLVAAFNTADADGSGQISKRELFALLEKNGIDRHSDRWKLFRVRQYSEFRNSDRQIDSSLHHSSKIFQLLLESPPSEL